MRKISLFIALVLSAPWLVSMNQAGALGQSKTSLSVNAISHIDLPVTTIDQRQSAVLTQGSELPLTLGRVTAAVDEAGNIYASISLTNGVDRALHQLIKYDSAGTVMATVKLPERIANSLGGLSSLTLQGGKLYAPSAWKNDAGEVRGGVLVFSNQGDFERLIELPLQFVPKKLLVTSQGIMYVVGEGPQMRNGRFMYADSPMVLKLNSSGQLLSAFSPFPTTTSEETLHLLSQSLQNYLLVDDAGHLIHVLPDASIRVFNADGQWLTTLTPALDTFDFLSAAFFQDRYLVLSTAHLATQRAFLYFVDQQGQIVTRIETTGKAQPIIKGHDGFYYSLAHHASSGRSRAAEVRITKLDLRAR